VDFIPRLSPEDNCLAATAGTQATAKVLGQVGFQDGPYLFYAAAQAEHTEGFTDPGWADAFRGFSSNSFALGANSSLTLISSHYYQDSAAADIVPKKWVDDGKVDRFGSLDDSDRVKSQRQLAGLTWDYKGVSNSARLQGYYNYKDTTIWSNYTFYLFNPERGDQQEMLDRRSVAGVNASYEHLFPLGSALLAAKGGVQWRGDWAHQVLANTERRERFNVINDLDFSENAIGAYLKLDLVATKWLEIVPGLRYDAILYEGEGTQDERYFNIYTNKADTRQDVPRNWDETAQIMSPKLSVILTPLSAWNLFLNYGEGFFSNTSQRMANEPTSEIPRVRGAEAGTRVFLFGERLTVATAYWYAEKEEDLVFDPSTGLSIERGATRRTGFETELRVSPLRWLYLMTDFFYIRARFLDPEGPIPNTPTTMMTNGAGIRHPSGARGMLRGRYVGPRELDQEDWADPYYVVDLVAGYDRESWGIELAIDNLLDTQWEDSVFSYPTRPEPNGQQYNGIHYTPGTPLAMRLTVSAKF